MKTLVLRIGALCLLLPLGACMNMSGLGGGSSYACKARKASPATRCRVPTPTRPQQPAQPAGQTVGRPAKGHPSEAARTDAARPSSSVATGDAAHRHAQSLASQAPPCCFLWIKPWEDADGDLYDQGVYVQVDNGQWQIAHVRRQIRDAYAPLKAPPKSATEATAGPNAGTRAGRADVASGPRSPTRPSTVA